MTATVKEQPQPRQKTKKRYTFQVLGGRHWEPHKVCPDCRPFKPLKEDGTCSTCNYDPSDGRQPLVKDVMHGPGCPAGDIVETDVDLAKRFNTPGYPPKFRRLGEDGVVDAHAQEVKEITQQRNRAVGTLKSALEKMTREGLLAWAEEQKIDVGNAVKREDVLRNVLAAMGL